MAGPIKIAILADAANAIRGLRDTGQAADDAGKRTMSFGKIIGGLGALGAGAALGAFFVDSFKGAEDALRITKLLDNQVRNLGPSGKAAFAGADSFAQTFGASIGQDDDDIKAVQVKLASFPDAFRQGSLGAEAMRRATAAAFDLQAIGIGDAQSNIIGIGKALNDPIKGMAALSKSGVSFTAEQKKQIENYVKQGDLAGAQRVLLAGIESNAKGAAAAAASPMDKIRVAVQNIGEGIAGSMLPAINTFANLLNDRIIPAAQKVGDWLGSKISAGFTALKPVIDTVRGWVSSITESFSAGGTDVTSSGFAGFLERLGLLARALFDTIRKDGPAVLAVLKSAFQGAFNAVKPLVTGGFDRISAAMDFIRKNQAWFKPLAVGIVAIVAAWKTWTLVTRLWSAVTVAATAVQTAFDAALDANPIGLIVLAVIGLVAAVVYAYKKFPAFRAVVDKTFRAIKTAITTVVDFLKPYVTQWLADARRIWDTVFPALKKTAEVAWAGIKLTVTVVLAYLKRQIQTDIAIIKAVWSGIQWLWDKAVEIFNGIKGAITTAIDFIKGIIAADIIILKTIWAGIQWLWDKAVEIFEGIKAAIGTAVDWVKQRITDGIEGLKAIWAGIQWLWDKAVEIFEGIKAAIGAAVDWVGQRIALGVEGLKAAWGGVQWLWDKAVGVFDGIKSAIATAVDWVKQRISDAVAGFRDAWSGIVGLADKAGEFKDRLFGIFADAWNWLAGVGSSIVDGLRRGIENSWHWVLDKIHDLVGLIPQKIRDLLGISSPSKVMADIGGQIMAGLTNGIAGSAPALTRQLSSVGSLIENGLSASPSIDLSASASGSRGAATINVNVTVSPLADPAEVGRQVVRSVRAYENTMGRKVLVGTAMP